MDVLLQVMKLKNLKEIFNSQQDWPRLVGVLDRLIVLNPNAVHEKRDRGLALFEMGETARAREDLSHYVSCAPDASDVPDIQKRLDKIQ